MIKIHDMLDDRKTKPGAALFAAAPFIHPVKPLKNTALALRRDADAGVADRQYHIRAPVLDLHPDFAALVVILDRVCQQIVKQLLHLAQIGT